MRALGPLTAVLPRRLPGSAPGSLCLREGRPESGREPGQGRGLFTLAVHAFLGCLP